MDHHLTFPTLERWGLEFAQVAVTLSPAYPSAKTNHVVLNDRNIHRRKSLTDVYEAKMAAEGLEPLHGPLQAQSRHWP